MPTREVIGESMGKNAYFLCASCHHTSDMDYNMEKIERVVTLRERGEQNRVNKIAGVL